MGKKIKFKNSEKMIAILKSLLGAYVLTGILLLGLAFLLYRFHLKERQISLGITCVYVLSTVFGGFLCGKILKVRKFLWGLVVGGTYFLFLLVVSLLVYKTMQQGSMNLVLSFVLCISGGMIGGMIS